ncbi:MAG TPA: PH domain-containing protein [Actinopolymorphaceae bacterium]
MSREPAHPPVLPHTWRPWLVPMVALGTGAALSLAALGMWFGLPAEARKQISFLQTLTLALILVALLFGLYRLARIRVSADETGLTIVNVLRTHRLEWPQVLAVNLRPGDPWVQLDVDDGTTLSVMAIQSADGARGRRAAQQLARLVEAKTKTSRND